MKKIINIIIIVLVVILVAIFISQNSDMITLRLLSWNIKSHTGLIILFSFLSGALITGLIWIIRSFHKNRTANETMHQDLIEDEEEHEATNE